MSEYTPTTSEIRTDVAVAFRYYGRLGVEGAEAFDRWLEQVRADERERCLKAVERSDADRTSGALRGKLAALAAIRAVSEQEEH